MAEIRPLITAGPMARASTPPKVFESISISAAGAAGADARANPTARPRIVFFRFMCVLPQTRKIGAGTGPTPAKADGMAARLLLRRRRGLLLRRHVEAGRRDVRVRLDLLEGHRHDAAGHARDPGLD